MRELSPALLAAAAFLVGALTACSPMPRAFSTVPGKTPMALSRGPAMPDINALMAKQRLSTDMMQEPDLPAWHDQREKMTLAVGDRVIDKSFDRTFDSMVIALANLGCRVNNMERQSGYITASLPQLPPEQKDALAKDGLAEYAQAKGYPASVLDDSGPYGRIGSSYPALMERMGAGLTLTMVRQGADRTKVKVRFDNVYYPRTVEELYKRLWDSVDKQIFLDRALDETPTKP